MTDPVRWSADKRAPSDVRQLLRRASRSRGLPADVRARSASRLDRVAVLPAAAGALFWFKGVAIAAGVIGVCAVVRAFPALLDRPLSSISVPAPPVSPQKAAGPAGEPGFPARPSRIAPLPVPPPASSPAPPPASSPTPARVRSGAVAPSAREEQSPRAMVSEPIAPTPSPSEEEAELGREAALLESARASLAQDPAAALGQIGECATLFPHGALRIERELIAVEALKRLGRGEEARARSAALLIDARGTIYEARVRALLASLPAPR